MNIQSGRMRTAEYHSGGSGTPSAGRRAAAIVKLVCALLLAGGLANAYIFLNQKITETARARRQVEREIRQVDRELATLRIRREKFTALPHIRASIAKYDLKLRQAEPGQVQALVLIPPGLAPQVSVAARTAPAAPQAPLRTNARALNRGAARP